MATYSVTILQTRRFTLEIEADSAQAALAIADNAPLPEEADSSNEEVLDIELVDETEESGMTEREALRHVWALAMTNLTVGCPKEDAVTETAVKMVDELIIRVEEMEKDPCGAAWGLLKEHGVFALLQEDVDGFRSWIEHNKGEEHAFSDAELTDALWAASEGGECSFDPLGVANSFQTSCMELAWDALTAEKAKEGAGP